MELTLLLLWVCASPCLQTTLVPVENVAINSTRNTHPQKQLNRNKIGEHGMNQGVEDVSKLRPVTEEDKNNRYRNFSLILQTLLRNYDKRLRPNFGSKPVNVAVTMHVSTISGVSESEMDFTVDFYLRQMWKDPRLAFSNNSKFKEITVGIELLSQIWKPDTFFPNEKWASFHFATVHNSFLRISPIGDIYSSQRITVTAACPMALRNFPFDKQTCTLDFESYGYGTEDITYNWHDQMDPFTISNDTWLPQFKLSNITIDRKVIKLSTGSYSRLYIHFLFQRDIGFYMMQVYLPATVIVSISLLSFWFPNYLLGDRIGLCFTAVLTMTVLMTTISNNLPKISYIKAIDIYMIVSFMIIYLILIESCLVAFMTFVTNQVKPHDEAADENNAGTETIDSRLGVREQCYTPGPAVDQKNKKLPTDQHKSPYAIKSLLAEKTVVTKVVHNRSNSNKGNRNDINIWKNTRHNDGRFIEQDPVSAVDGGFNGESGNLGRENSNFQRGICFMKRCCYKKQNTNILDHYSRRIFPTVFVIFNFVYWAVYLPIAMKVQKGL